MKIQEVLAESQHFLKPGELRGSYTDVQLRALGFRQVQNGSWYISKPRWQQLIQSGQLQETEQEILEITRISPQGFEAGEDYWFRNSYPRLSELKKINNKLSYRIKKTRSHGTIEIYTLDPSREIDFAAELTLDQFRAGDIDTWQVGTIGVNPRYRAQGLASLLYQIYFREVNPTLISGDMQTPGGRRNWASLARNPNIEVTGLLGIGLDFTDQDLPKATVDAWIEKIMSMGAVYRGERGWWYWFQIPIESKDKVLKVTKFKLYHDEGQIPSFGKISYFMLLLATWKGR